MKKMLIVLLFASAAFAQEDPIAQQLFPPELIMAQSQKLHLDDKQRTTIKTEVQRAQSKFFDLQWQLKEASDAMVQLLQQTPVDEARVLEQADKVMGFEHDIKKIQLTLLIRIKNALTPEQIAQLKQSRLAK
ncbi:MAG TPA: periplasmic heavy metal sensor [Thermoanaerobaculia bacterium]